MKKYIMILAAATALGFTSCGSDYLDTTPNSDVSRSTAFSTTEKCALAVNGLSKQMTNQYLGSQGLNGEGTILNWYNNFNGNDCQKCAQTGWSSLWNNLASFKTSKTSMYGYYPWYYYYKLIGNANSIIDAVDAAEGTESAKAFVKAQALVFRAYSFYRLTTLYCKRWSDSKNGATSGIVLRLKATDPAADQSQAQATLAETYQQIYADLDQAISLFSSSSEKRTSKEFYLPDLSVAYAVKARAALYREDWQTAADCAAKARVGHTLMGQSAYKNGFNSPNDEWIWGVYEAEDQTLYYYSYYAYIGSNASSGAARTYPVAISKELIDQIPATDVRRDLYLVPQSDAEFKTMAASGGTAGRITKGNLYNRAVNSGYLYSTSRVYGYMQFKLRASFMPGGGSFNLFRAAEMYYTEAEADCHLGKETEARQLLYDVVHPYDAAYTLSSKTGNDLLEEVKLYRRFDLFGEGFDWTDCKRWKKDIVRKPLKVSAGLASPGSFSSTFAITIPADDDTRWIWAIPNREVDYNSAITEE